MSYLRLTNVTKMFGTVRAVDSLNLDIAKGECFSMLGPSGCGKTTTLRMVAGFEDIDDGEIAVDDKLMSSKVRNYYLPPEKRNFGMVFQAFAVWPHLSVRENVAFPLRLRKLTASEITSRTNDALQHTNLLSVAESSPESLSGGGKQRVALARALAINPAVMLLDEPLSSLDPHLREEMRFEIKDLQKHYGFTILYVTHDQGEAMALSDRIMVMKSGVVQQIDSPVNIYTHPVNKFVFGFIGLSNFTPVHIHGGCAHVHGSEQSLPVPEDCPVSGEGTMATRPSEISFVSEGGLRGIVTRRTYLGEIVDYSVKVGDQELRVQTGRRQSGPQEGEHCAVGFALPFWYAE
ncbi:MAG: ABC transporter ATP-binding protein [Desulfovibrionaceae bacterium]